MTLQSQCIIHLANVLNVYMNKRYKLIQAEKTYTFNYELALAQNDGWTAIPETLKSAPDFFSVFVQKDAPTVALSVTPPVAIDTQRDSSTPTENYPNSIGHRHDCGCCVCK